MTKKTWGIVLTVLGSIVLVFNLLLVLISLLAGLGVSVMGMSITGLMSQMMQLQVPEGTVVETTSGYIEEVGDGYTVVSYWVDGETYEKELTFSSSSLPEGTSVTVEYEASNPNNAAVADASDIMSSGGLIAGGSGIMVTVLMSLFFLPAILIGLAMLIVGIVLIKKGNKELKLTRKPIPQQPVQWK